jgi:hypothetical protein
MFVRFSTGFGRFSIGFSTRFSTSVSGLSVSGLSTGVSGVPAGVKPAVDFCFDEDSLLNPDPLDSDKAGSISRRCSNRRTAARKVAFVWIQASGNCVPGSAGVLSDLARVCRRTGKGSLSISPPIRSIAAKVSGAM